MMKILRDHRDSFGSYDGPVEYLTVRFSSQSHVLPGDTETMLRYINYCEDNFHPEAYWVMWAPKRVVELVPEAAAVVAFKCASDAALFLLTHDCGLMRSGYVRKGILHDTNSST